MPASAHVIDTLRRTGRLWDVGPGLTAMRGDVLDLFHWMDRELADLATAASAETWSLPPAMAFETLERADYFASFPQWLTATSHFEADVRALERVAASEDPTDCALSVLRPLPYALQPAVCYHVYAALAGRVLEEAHTYAVAGTCWRHESGCFAPLERGWAFTMREVVCIGDSPAVEQLRSHGSAAALRFAERLGLQARIEPASDPFFAPSARGRALLQRIRGLKHELLLPLGDGREVAAASFNDHAEFFGNVFDIRMRAGVPATSGCVAFGVERWLLAFLVEHGTDPDGWPVRPSSTSERIRA